MIHRCMEVFDRRVDIILATCNRHVPLPRAVRCIRAQTFCDWRLFDVNVVGEEIADHWTEKFADAILCECLPFYAGDPALTEVFPAESLIPRPSFTPARSSESTAFMPSWRTDWGI